MLGNITVTAIRGVFTVFSPAGRHEEIKKRKCYGLSFCSEGKITYAQNGVKTVSDKNHAVILPMGGSYEISGDEPGSFPVINFLTLAPVCSEIISVPIQSAKPYMKDFESLKLLSLISGRRAEMMSVFYRMLQRLSGENTVCKTIEPAVRFIEKNYHDSSLNAAMCASECGISEVYLRKLFVEHMKLAPKQFLIELRLNKAKQLLSEGVLKIGAVASECGFSNQYHFCRLFKERVGMTPTEYMLQNRNFMI